MSLDYRQALPDLSSIAELTAKRSVKKHSSNGRCWNCCVGLENVALVCEHYRISRATLYRWKAQFNPRRADALEERSRRPGRTRVPQYSTQLQRRVIELRRQYGWGKDKLVVLVAAFGCCSHPGAYQLERAVNMRPVLLEREGLHTSASTVGRILTHARERGVLVEPQRMSVKMRKRRWSRLPAAGRPSCCQKAQRLAESSVLEIWSRWTPWTSGGTCRSSVSSSPPETW